jgi:hypothetical protein
VTDFKLLFGILTPEGFEATYSANLSQIGYTAPTGGDPLGANFLSSDDFEILIGGGFNPQTNYLGTFSETILSTTFIGTAAGNAVVDELDPSPTSVGSVTISLTTREGSSTIEPLSMACTPSTAATPSRCQFR